MNNIVNNNSYKILDMGAYILVIVGAINWGLIGLLNFDLILFFFQDVNIMTRIIYSLVGISGLRILYIICSKACHYNKNR